MSRSGPLTKNKEWDRPSNNQIDDPFASADAQHLRNINSRAAASTVVGVVTLAVVPFFGLPIFILQVLTLVFLNAISAVSLSVSYGYCGLLNFSQATFIGIGAYTTAYLMANMSMPFGFAIVCGCALATVAGFALGLASIRVKGDYFALVSFAFTIIVSQIFVNWSSVTGGLNGFSGIPEASFFGLPIVTGRSAYWATLAALVASAVLVVRIARGYAGRAMLSVRFDPIAAASNGVAVTGTRLFAMGVSSAIAGLAGAMQVATIAFVSPQDFEILTSFEILLWVIIGGETKVLSIIMAAGILTFVTEEFRSLSQYSVGISGLLVLVTVYLRSGVFSDLARWIRRTI